MPIAQAKLPYDKDALEPHVSKETISYHFDRHHSGYVDTLNKLIEDTDYAGLSLEEVISKARKEVKTDILNNACQAWNHDFFWKSLSPQGGKQPSGMLKELINGRYNGIGDFKQQFRRFAMNQFGSGWIWLVADQDKVSIVSTSNAATPLGTGVVPLLTLDVWEHAYYLDYRNERARYVEAFLDHLINWDFAAGNLKGLRVADAA